MATPVFDDYFLVRRKKALSYLDNRNTFQDNPITLLMSEYGRPAKKKED